jgi:hypothetical protein
MQQPRSSINVYRVFFIHGSLSKRIRLSPTFSSFQEICPAEKASEKIREYCECCGDVNSCSGGGDGDNSKFILETISLSLQCACTCIYTNVRSVVGSLGDWLTGWLSCCLLTWIHNLYCHLTPLKCKILFSFFGIIIFPSRSIVSVKIVCINGSFREVSEN